MREREKPKMTGFLVLGLGNCTDGLSFEMGRQFPGVGGGTGRLVLNLLSGDPVK